MILATGGLRWFKRTNPVSPSGRAKQWTLRAARDLATVKQDDRGTSYVYV
jgi:hypothetical protein